MKIQVDSTKCQGYGVCEQVAAALLVLDEFGYAAASGDGTVPPDQLEAAEMSGISREAGRAPTRVDLHQEGASPQIRRPTYGAV